MMFRTELHLAPAATQFNLAANVVTVGSCFSEVIGRQLEKYRVNTLTNPFGTIFNPLSACKLLQICAGADVELADSFVENNGRWFSYDFHSSFSAPTEEELYEQLDEAIVKTRRFLKKADLLVITLGTANIFRLNITGETVANCHKLPAANFTRETLQPEEIISAIAETHSLLRELNPKLRIILSVSPVRHLKDTLELNSVSKSVLRLATHFLAQLPDTDYFPAYELLLDDLRDYRFYKDDLLHPSEMAEKYIWEKFSKVYFNQSFHTFSADWDTVLSGMAHRAFHPESAGHQAFVQQMLEKLRRLQSQTDVTEQLAYFESQVIIPPVLDEPDEEEDEEGEIRSEEEIEAAEIAAAAEQPTILLPEGAAIEAEPLPEAALSEAETALAAQEGGPRKRKKKNRKKKKKPFGPAEAESATASADGDQAIMAPERPESVTPASGNFEAETPIAAVTGEQDENLASRSKSAKKRANRRKKKSQSDREADSMPDVQVSTTANAGPWRTVEAEHGFDTEAATPALLPDGIQPERRMEQIQGTEAKQENAEIPAATSRPIKPARQRPERKPSRTAEPTPEPGITDLPGNQISEERPSEEARSNGLNQETEPSAQAEGTMEQVTGKPKRSPKGRKPKMAALFNPETDAKPVTETIAVPFVPAAALEAEPSAQKAPEAAEAPKKRGRAKSPAKAAAKEKPEPKPKSPAKAKGPAKGPAKGRRSPGSPVPDSVPKPETIPEPSSSETAGETAAGATGKRPATARKTPAKGKAKAAPAKPKNTPETPKAAKTPKPKAARGPRKNKENPEA